MGKHKEIDDINLSITLLDKRYKKFLDEFKIALIVKITNKK